MKLAANNGEQYGRREGKGDGGHYQQGYRDSALNEPPGVYFVCATTARGNYVVKVVVK